METSGQLHIPGALLPRRQSSCTHWMGLSPSACCGEKKIFLINKNEIYNLKQNNSWIKEFQVLRAVNVDVMVLLDVTSYNLPDGY